MTLIEALQTIPDHRRGAGRRYPLWVFLLLIILGTISGYRGDRGLSRFMLRHQEHLSERLGWRRSQLPSYATIRRLLMEIDLRAVATAFNQWAQSAGLVESGDHCAVDGKSLKNTLSDPHQSQQNFVNIVSVFQLEYGLVVGQAAFENQHQSEIKAVYDLLEQLQLSGVTVSLDALHAQKTVELLHEQGNDYVISVKANQKTLYQQLQALVQSDTVFSLHLDTEQTRDRQTTRMASVFPLPDRLKAIWIGSQQGVEVIRSGTRQGEPYFERRYYITSWMEQAEA